MNQPYRAPSTPVDANPPGTISWTAIAAGAGASLAIGFSASVLMRPLYTGGSMGYALMVTLGFSVSMLADAIGGAVAGFMAKHRGALHGALAMVGASAFGVVASMVMMSRQGHLEMLGSLQYWVKWLLYAVIGLGVGTVAGLVASKVAAKQQP